MRIGALQDALDVSDNTFKRYRKRCAKWEHHEAKGSSRGHWIFLPGWLRDHRAATESRDGAEADGSELGEKQRMRAIRLRNAELDLEERELKHAERRAQLVDLDAFYRDRFGPGLDLFRLALDRLSPWPQAQSIAEGGVLDLIEALQANGSTNHLIGSRPTRSAGKGKAPAAKAAHPPRIRPKVRDDAAGRADGRPEIS